MTFNEVSAEYNRQCSEHQAAYQAWNSDPATVEQRRKWLVSRGTNRRKDDVKVDPPEFPGPHIDYGKIDTMLIQAAMDEYGFSKEQAGFIHGIAYEQYHATYSDVPIGMAEMCDQFKRWDELKAKQK